MGKVYNVYCNGFSKTFPQLSAVQPHIEWLRANGCVGKEIVIRIGRGDMKAAVYAPGHPVRSEILKAA